MMGNTFYTRERRVASNSSRHVVFVPLKLSKYSTFMTNHEHVAWPIAAELFAC